MQFVQDCSNYRTRGRLFVYNGEPTPDLTQPGPCRPPGCDNDGRDRTKREIGSRGASAFRGRLVGRQAVGGWGCGEDSNFDSNLIACAQAVRSCRCRVGVNHVCPSREEHMRFSFSLTTIATIGASLYFFRRCRRLLRRIVRRNDYL